MYACAGCVLMSVCECVCVHMTHLSLALSAGNGTKAVRRLCFGRMEDLSQLSVLERDIRAKCAALAQLGAPRKPRWCGQPESKCQVRALPVSRALGAEKSLARS